MCLEGRDDGPPLGKLVPDVTTARDTEHDAPAAELADKALRWYSQQLGEAPGEAGCTGPAQAAPGGETRGTGGAGPKPHGRPLVAELERDLGLVLGTRGDHGDADLGALVQGEAQARRVDVEVERRIDPADARLRTLQELQVLCAGEYMPAEIVDYWQTKCRPVTKPEKRIDPADGQLRTFKELEAWCRGAYSHQEIDAYWQDRCKPFIELSPTFGYVANLEKHPPYAGFDVRDEVCLRVGGYTHGQVVCDCSGSQYVVIGVKRAGGTPQLWFEPEHLGRPGACTLPTDALVKGMGMRPLHEVSVRDCSSAEDSDGEELVLCHRCRLPVGNFAHAGGSGGGAPMHGDCRAETMRQEWHEGEELRRRREAATRSARREEYGIGWSPGQIPRNLGPASRLGSGPVPQGMCCLVLHREPLSLHVAATLNPASSLNLEYLALALQVRRRSGTEPVFSLDPVESGNPFSMQRKRFMPDWLAGTSAGDVLFQADYHLKELSMGEQQQPVVGMKSSFDFSAEGGHREEWSAREWFVVGGAEVQLASGGILVPRCEMGVEARAQIVDGGGGMEDARVTSPGHPLVRYADAFTHNFDLIAERKSVIFHLRELAKATILAKYLLDAEIPLDEPWLKLECKSAAAGASPQVVPQLWNERARSEVCLVDGAIVGDGGEEEGGGPGGRTRSYGVYGGIQFGLHKFALATMPSTSLMRPGALSAGRAAGLSAGEKLLISHLGGPSATVTKPRMRARGVDLNLDHFDLSATAEVSLDEAAGGLSADPQSCVSVHGAFWSNVDGESGSVFKDQDLALLRDVFNPSLSDRREEGDRFVPPECSPAYIRKLRDLVEEERRVRQARREHFLGADFEVGNPGTLFPSSWTPSFAVTCEQAPEARGRSPANQLTAHPGYAADARVLKLVLGSESPAFDKSTEDGVRFRIYHFGSLEVRTTQEGGGTEVVGAVFSTRAPLQAAGESEESSLPAGEKVVKVTEYVERDPRCKGGEPIQCAPYGRYYVALWTEQGDVVVTEKLRGGSVTWEENPEHIEDRISLSKVVRSAHCPNKCFTLRDMRKYQARAQQCAERVASGSAGKLYARSAYNYGVAMELASFGQAAAEGHQQSAEGSACSAKELRAPALDGVRGSPMPDEPGIRELSEISIQLHFPTGDVEPLVVDADSKGIAVLQKMMPLKKKYTFLDGVQIFRSDGVELEFNTPIHAQGVHADAILYVQ